MLGVIMKTSSWFYYLLCYCIYEKVPIHVTSAQGTTQNALYISWKRKSKIFYDKQFTKVATHKKCSKLLKWKMIQSTYNINTQCNLLFAEKNGIVTLFETSLNCFAMLIKFVVSLEMNEGQQNG